MNKIATMLLSLNIALFSYSSHAANPNPKPNCPFGKIPVLEGNLWQCKEPGYSTGEKSEEAGLLLPAIQKVREAAASNGSQAQPAGPRPQCPKGQIAKLEMGQWQCKPMDLTSRPNEQRAGYMKFDDIKGESQGAPSAGPRPQCRKGELPKLENGQWRCRQPDLAVPTPAQR